MSEQLNLQTREYGGTQHVRHSPRFITATGEVASWLELNRHFRSILTSQEEDPRFSGGSSSIFIGMDRRVMRPVAIKVLTKPEGRNDVLFQNEQYRLQQLSHPHLPDIGEELTLEIDGEIKPAFLLEHLSRVPTWLPVKEVSALVSDIGNVLQYLHSHEERISHGDVKPSNILRRVLQAPCPTTNRRFYYILADHGTTLGADDLWLGYPTAFSPEYADSDADSLSRDSLKYAENRDKMDQYSLALTAFELLIGRTLTETERGNLPESLPRHEAFSPELMATLSQALSLSRHGRFESIAEFASRFQSALQSLATSADVDENGKFGGLYLSDVYLTG